MQDSLASTWYDDRVEQYVDDTLDENDRVRFENRLHSDDLLMHKVDFASRIKDSLSKLPSPEIPRTILTNVQRAIAVDNELSQIRRSNLRLVSSRLRRVAYAAVGVAACVILFLVVSPLVTSVNDLQEPVPSQADVDRALLEVKQTLAFVSDMGNERTQIVNGHVVEPVQKAMSYIFQSENATVIQ